MKGWHWWSIAAVGIVAFIAWKMYQKKNGAAALPGASARSPTTRVA